MLLFRGSFIWICVFFIVILMLSDLFGRLKRALITQINENETLIKSGLGMSERIINMLERQATIFSEQNAQIQFLNDTLLENQCILKNERLQNEAFKDEIRMRLSEFLTVLQTGLGAISTDLAAVDQRLQTLFDSLGTVPPEVAAEIQAQMSGIRAAVAALEPSTTTPETPDAPVEVPTDVPIEIPADLDVEVPVESVEVPAEVGGSLETGLELTEGGEESF